MSPQNSADTTIRAILDASAMTHLFVRQAVEDVPESRMAEQFGPITNHPAWTLAHLGAYASLLLEVFDEPGASSADAELERFGYGTIPVADLAAYPAKGELMARLADRHTRLAQVIAAKHAAYFPRPAPEKFRAYTPTIGRLAVILLVSHESYHLGQLKLWRRAAGLTGTQ